MKTENSITGIVIEAGCGIWDTLIETWKTIVETFEEATDDCPILDSFEEYYDDDFEWFLSLIADNDAEAFLIIDDEDQETEICQDGAACDALYGAAYDAVIAGLNKAHVWATVESAIKDAWSGR